MKTANVTVNILNQATQLSLPTSGIAFAQGETVRGEPFNPNQIITTWDQFKTLYGSYHPTKLFPLYCKTMLDNGVALRVNKVVNLSDPTDRTSITATYANSTVESLIVVDAPIPAASKIQVKVNGGALVDLGIAYSVATHANMNNYIKTVVVPALKAITEVKDVIYSENTLLMGTAGTYTLCVIPKPGVALAFSNGGITPGVGVNVLTPLTTSIPVYSYDGLKLFSLEHKQPGSGLNGFSLKIFDPSLGTGILSDKVTMQIKDADGVVIEEFLNLTMPYVLNANGFPVTLIDIKFWNHLTELSTFFKFVPSTLFTSSTTLTVKPVPTALTLTFKGGTEGIAPAIGSWTGDASAKTGIYAFSEYEDSYALITPEYPEADFNAMVMGLNTALKPRKNLLSFIEMPSNLTTATNLIAARNAASSDDIFVNFFTGGLKFIDPVSGSLLQGSALPGVIIDMVKVHKTYGEWRAFTNLNNGTIDYAVGVVNNFGTTAMLADRELLAQVGINCIVQMNGKVMLWDDYSGKFGNSPQQFICTNILGIYMAKVFNDSFMKFLGEPLDLQLVRQMYHTNKPFIESLIKRRAFSTLTYVGDQDASSPADLKVNTAAAFAMGNYKARVEGVTIAPLKTVSFDIVYTGTGVSVEIQ